MPISRDDTLKWIRASARVIAENREFLTQLNAATGDADHGANMDRGFQAVLARMPEIRGQNIGTIFKTVGMTLHSKVGGAGGPLYGTFFLQAGMKAAGKMELSLIDWGTVLQAALNGIVMRGNAGLGDKTMVDTLIPAVNALHRAAEKKLPFKQALILSTEAAKKGMENTTHLVARKGRASFLGDRSTGHQDPGATSMFLILKAAADTWANN